MHGPLRWWERWFLGEGSLLRLGAFRVAILVVALWDLVGYGFLVLADADAVSAGGPVRPWRPIYAFELLGLEPIGLEAARAVYAAALAAIALGIAGLLTRTALVVVALLSFYWTGLAYSFGKPHHDKVALTFALLALPLSPAGARLSLDSAIARWRRARRGGDPTWAPERAELAMLPIRLTQITVALGYFFAGGSKLLLGGTGWLNGYTLMGIMMGHDAPWSAWFSQNLPALRVMSVGLVLTQLTFPLIFVWPALRWYYVPVMIVMHLLTWQTMDTGPYFALWGTLVCFVPLERVPRTVGGWLESGPWLRRLATALGGAALVAAVAVVLLRTLPAWVLALWLPLAVAAALALMPRAKITVVWDGGCGLCRRAVAVLCALDWAQRCELLSLTEWPQVSRRFPPLHREACLRDLHAIDAAGRVHVGYAAYQQLGWRLPLLAPLAWCLWLPPVVALGRRLYRRVADGRRRDGADGVCSVR